MVEKVLKGSPKYYLWLLFLLAIIGYAFIVYVFQLIYGLQMTGLTRNTSWGFYIAQSMFYALWRRAVDALMSLAFAGGSSFNATIGVIDLVAAGIAGSLAVVAVLIAVDALTRTPLLRLVRLQR